MATPLMARVLGEVREQALYARWTAEDARRVVRLGAFVLYRRPSRLRYVKLRLRAARGGHA